MISTPNSNMGRSRLALPRLSISDGTVEALKYVALLMMVCDHIDKYLLHGRCEAMFAIGRMAMPIFGFVLAFNLAREGSFVGGAYQRAMTRQVAYGLLATPAFIALGGLVSGWWPLNIMFMLAGVSAVLYLIERDGVASKLAAFAVFMVVGSSVEFWWPAMILCIAAWAYCKRPSLTALCIWVWATAALWFINRNFWALGALPLIFAAPYVQLRVPRISRFFYFFYPAHLFVLAAIHAFVFAGVANAAR